MNPEGRWYPALLGALGVAFLGGSAVLLVVMLATVIGPFSLESVRTPPGALEETRIGVWTPPSARQLARVNRARVRAVWQTAFGEGALLEESDQLEDLLDRGVQVVAVSDARALSVEEQAELERFARRGGGVLLSGWVAVRSPTQTWLGTVRMRDLLDVEEIETLPFAQADVLAAGRSGPLRAGIDPARRIVLPRAFEAPAIPDPAAELYWADGRLTPRSPSSGATRRRRLGRGSLVWIATPPFAETDRAGADALRAVYQNAVAWTRRQVRHELLPWPRGAPFAALLALDTAEGLPDARHVIAVSRRHQIPVTYLVVSSLAERFPDVFEELAASGEIGSHGDVHEGFAGLPLEQQQERIGRSLDHLRALGAVGPTGFRPPYESADVVTLEAAARAGVGYVLGDPELVSLVPRMVSAGKAGSPLVCVPRGVADDVELLTGRGLHDPDALLGAMQRELAHVASVGGLYYLSMHTRHLARPDYASVLDRVVEELERRGAWWVSGAELARWWRVRSSLRTSLVQTTAVRLVLEVSNQGHGAAAGAVVRVHLPEPAGDVRVSSATVLTGAPRVRYLPGSRQLDVALPEIPAGQSRRYTLDLDLAPAS